jgi:tRNA U34 5-methylaminomethyl-2-thiouridine-forming methyltransferase MnmC
MTLEIFTTLDGSDTLFVPELNEHYHSRFGAVQESRQVFIEHGFMAVKDTGEPVKIFEMGFGTGLNTLLTLLAAKELNLKVNYTSIEKFPLHSEVWERLNYGSDISLPGSRNEFREIHEAPWDQAVGLTGSFTLKKIHADIAGFIPAETGFDVVYFDAFSPDVQPDLWTQEVLGPIGNWLKPGGILVTYSCKGSVKRILKANGFKVEKLPGPPGKRTVLRGIRKDVYKEIL